MTTNEQIRYSEDGSISMIWADGEPVRCPDPLAGDMDLPVGPDMTDDEVDALDE